MGKRDGYVWNKKTDNELQLWPHTSREHYLTRPFIDGKAINRKKQRAAITSPREPFIDFLARQEIVSAALTTHKGGYYQARSGADFHLLIYTVRGGAHLKLGKKKLKISKSSLFISPAGSSYEFESDPIGWEVFWFHLRQCKMWDKIVGAEIWLGASDSCAKLKNLTDIYADEIYSDAPMQNILNPCAETISALIKKDLSARGRVLRVAEFDRFFSELNFAPVQYGSLRESAAALSVSPRKLNEYCLTQYGNTYAKVLLKSRMSKATAMLADKIPLAEIAVEVGYADAFTLSKAFKNYFGISPKSVCKLKH